MGRKRQFNVPINVTIRLEKATAKRIQELARRRRVSTGAVLREMVDRYMGLSRVQKELMR